MANTDLLDKALESRLGGAKTCSQFKFLAPFRTFLQMFARSWRTRMPTIGVLNLRPMDLLSLWLGGVNYLHLPKHKPPSSPFRKGERGGLCTCWIKNMYMLLVDAALMRGMSLSPRTWKTLQRRAGSRCPTLASKVCVRPSSIQGPAFG